MVKDEGTGSSLLTLSSTRCFAYFPQTLPFRLRSYKLFHPASQETLLMLNTRYSVSCFKAFIGLSSCQVKHELHNQRYLSEEQGFSSMWKTPRSEILSQQKHKKLPWISHI